MQASLAAFLSRGKPQTAPPEVPASATAAARDQGTTQPVTAVQEQPEPQQTVAHHRQRQQQQQQQQKQQPPVPAQEHMRDAMQQEAAQQQPQQLQLEGEGSETYAAQLSAAIAASLADAGVPPEQASAAQPAARQASRAIDNRLPVRTDSYLDLLNNRQYRSWAAFISQAGQGSGSGCGSGAGQQSAAATAWQVLNPCSALLSCATFCRACYLPCASAAQVACRSSPRPGHAAAVGLWC